MDFESQVQSADDANECVRVCVKPQLSGRVEQRNHFSVCLRSNYDYFWSSALHAVSDSVPVFIAYIWMSMRWCGRAAPLVGIGCIFFAVYHKSVAEHSKCGLAIEWFWVHPQAPIFNDSDNGHCNILLLDAQCALRPLHFQRFFVAVAQFFMLINYKMVEHNAMNGALEVLALIRNGWNMNIIVPSMRFILHAMSHCSHHLQCICVFGLCVFPLLLQSAVARKRN